MSRIDEIKARLEASLKGDAEADQRFLGHVRLDMEYLLGEIERLNTALTGAKHIADSAGQTIRELRAALAKAEAELVRVRSENKRLELLCELYGEERSKRAEMEGDDNED